MDKGINIVRKFERFYNGVPPLWTIKFISFLFGLKLLNEENRAPIKISVEKKQIKNYTKSKNDCIKFL